MKLVGEVNNDLKLANIIQEDVQNYVVFYSIYKNKIVSSFAIQIKY